jgi:anti-sigma regulatory factor (Ser/Thr protein kinase)/CheY-like chemotaxis protein
MSTPIRLLIVEDSALDAMLVERALTRGGFQPFIERAESFDELASALSSATWDAVISDYDLPGFAGHSALNAVKLADIYLPFIVVSGTIGEESAVEMMRAGADDYVMKNNLSRLAPALSRELQRAKMHRAERAEQVGREGMRQENISLQAEVVTALIRQRLFVREMLYAVTDGKLILCDSEAEIPTTPLIRFGPYSLEPKSMRDVRVQVQESALKLGVSEERRNDIVMAVGEATMNAVVHGADAVANIWASDDCLRIRIEDKGPGMDLSTLHRATMDKGYTTAGSRGFGFFIMLSVVDRVYLLTGPSGTTIVLEQQLDAPEPAWMLNDKLSEVLAAA